MKKRKEIEEKIINQILKEREKKPEFSYYVQSNLKTKGLDLYAQPFGSEEHFIRTLCRNNNYDRCKLISLFLEHRIYT